MSVSASRMFIVDKRADLGFGISVVNVLRSIVFLPLFLLIILHEKSGKNFIFLLFRKVKKSMNAV